MNDIYSPPEADISTNEERAAPTFLRSLGGFFVSFIVAYLAIYLAGAIYGLLVPFDSASAVVLYGSAILSLLIHVAWVTVWPMFCRRRGWPNLYRGGRWHRLVLLVAVIVLALFVVLSKIVAAAV